MDVKVEVKGIKELQRAFKQVDDGMKSALKVKLLDVARSVASAIQGKVPKVTGKAASSIKPKASNYGASIAFGGSVAEHYPWLDFGGSVGRGDSIKRPFIKTGRYVYPTIADKGDDIEEAVEDALHDLARRAGFETEGL